MADSSNMADSPIVVIEGARIPEVNHDENAPLLPVENNHPSYKEHSTCFAAIIRLFYVFCFCTGQFTSPWAKVTQDGNSSREILYYVLWIIFVYGCSTLFLVIGVLLNSCSLAFDIFAIVTCKFNPSSCDFIYSNFSHQKLYQSLTINPSQFNNWQKTVITTATVSGALSYIFIIIVLYGQYSCLFWCYNKYRRSFSKSTGPSHHDMEQKTPQHDIDPRTDDKRIVMNPFLDGPYTVDTNILTEITRRSNNGNFMYLSTITTRKQARYFLSIFWFNFLVFGTTVGLLVTIVVRNIHSSNPSLEAFDILGLGAQFFSQFCAILSCFIFSKVAYAVSNRCLDFYKHLFILADIDRNGTEQTNWENLRSKLPFEDGVEATHLQVLKKMDQIYVKLVKQSLGPYGTWFAIHWVLYTVTAFMSIAYFIDQVEMQLYGKGKCHDGLVDPVDCQLVLAYSFFFAIEHCVLFLYPCFRAASVTQARSQMIKFVSRREWMHVQQADVNSFVTYLKDQNCTFKVTILCAELSFGFNMAYISIFIGILSLILKVSL